MEELEDVNQPWRRPEGNCTWTHRDMKDLCSVILKGEHPTIAASTQKEILRCINNANNMFRDTLRDIDEGEACSEASNPPKKHRKSKKKALVAQGQVPTLDLLRIWDTGASQGMVDKAVVSSKNAFTGDEVSLSTGNGTISSKRYERCEIAPGLPQVHVALPNTANTVSLAPSILSVMSEIVHVVSPSGDRHG